MLDLHLATNWHDVNHDGHIDRHDQDLNGDGVISTNETHMILKKLGITADPGTAAAKQQFAKILQHCQQSGKFLGIDIPEGRSLGWDLLKYKLIVNGHSAEAAEKICAKIKLMKYGR